MNGDVGRGDVGIHAADIPPQGYVLIEYSTLDDAKAAIKGANGQQLLEQEITVDFAFVRPPPSGPKRGREGERRGAGRGRGRSRSPGRSGEDMDD